MLDGTDINDHANATPAQRELTWVWTGSGNSRSSPTCLPQNMGGLPAIHAQFGLAVRGNARPQGSQWKDGQAGEPAGCAAPLTDCYFSLGKKDFQPRVGFAWQVNGSGTTVLRAGFGILHDHIMPNAYVGFASILGGWTLNGISTLRAGRPLRRLPGVTVPEMGTDGMLSTQPRLIQFAVKVLF